VTHAPNGGASDKPSAAVQASIATFTKGGMGTVRIAFPCPPGRRTPSGRRAAGLVSQAGTDLFSQIRIPANVAVVINLWLDPRSDFLQPWHRSRVRSCWARARPRDHQA
jgi:hypothetical protein